MRREAIALVLIAYAGALSACEKDVSAEKPKPRPFELVEPSLCSLVTFEDAAKALGAPPVGATDTSNNGALSPGCSWMAAAGSLGVAPRTLAFTVWRKKALDMQGSPMSGRLLFDGEVANLQEEFGATQPLPGVGQEAVIAHAIEPGGRVRAKIVVIKGPDVMTMRLTGADRAELEAIAVRVAAKM